jgi:hypothetical protein
MKHYQLSVLIIVFSLLVFACDESQSAEQEQIRLADSIQRADSLAVAIFLNHANDSAHRCDSIRALPCPELADFIRLNEKAIALLAKPISSEALSAEYTMITDSIAIVEHKLMQEGDNFEKLPEYCRKRYLALSLIYSKDITNAVMAQMGAAGKLAKDPNLDRKTDSLAWQMEFGK